MSIANRKNICVTKTMSFILVVSMLLTVFSFTGESSKAYAAAPVPTNIVDAIKAVVTTPETVGVSGTLAWTNAAAYAAKQKVVEQPMPGYFYHNFPGTAVVPTADRPAAIAALANRT